MEREPTETDSSLQPGFVKSSALNSLAFPKPEKKQKPKLKNKQIGWGITHSQTPHPLSLSTQHHPNNIRI